MATIMAGPSRPKNWLHDGKTCEVLRSVTAEDADTFDVALAKSVVKLDDGSEIIVANIELIN